MTCSQVAGQSQQSQITQTPIRAQTKHPAKAKRGKISNRNQSQEDEQGFGFTVIGGIQNNFALPGKEHERI